MLKRIGNYKLILLQGAFDGTVYSLTVPDGIKNKNFVIEKIIPQMFYENGVGDYNLLNENYADLIQTNIQMNFLINGAFQQSLNYIPIAEPLTDLNLFVENLQTLSFDGVLQGVFNYISVTFFIYGYVVDGSFNKTKEQFNYDK